MAPREIIIKIEGNEGKLTTEAKGFKGTSCLKETLKLLDGLNPVVKTQQLRPEYNQVGIRERVAEH